MLRRPSPRVLLVAALVVGATGVVAAAADGGDPEPKPVEVATATTSTSTTSTSAGSSSTTTVPPVPSTTAPPATSPPPTVPPTTEPPPATVPPTTVPPTTAPPPTAPPPPPAPDTASVAVENHMNAPLDVSINAGFLRMGPNESRTVDVLAEVPGNAGDLPPGSDLITVSIPPDFGSPDAGCGSHSLGQLLAPGGRYRMRIAASGTCQLLGGGAKPAFTLSAR